MPPRYLQQGLRALIRADQPLRGGACPFTKSPSPCFRRCAGPPRMRQRRERRRRVTVPPMHPTGRQHVPIGARSLTGGDMGGALCDVGGTGSPSARGRAVRRSWRISTCSVPGPRGPRIRGREWISPVPHSPDADGRHRLAEAGGTAAPAALPVNVIDVAPAGDDHAGSTGIRSCTGRGPRKGCVEFLLSLRQRLTNLVDAGSATLWWTSRK